ncbi:ABC transporter substrate-binding protein [Brockia lithotrophica]|uniref:ABC-type nitrate/sulfonate/bicarbonate transport system substrate-binding protein n=1 Tax=Brockia lithotrophica TaxID=933949 RepID=A0A660L6N5_9BACL|nr:hypothetical protein [Brockia lithotrophica]RKQ89088.1 ABC-type nitrate/sulfonate/bicarbonate transport system substrate-binding protein [Brockia lithotrophica]
MRTTKRAWRALGVLLLAVLLALPLAACGKKAEAPEKSEPATGEKSPAANAPASGTAKKEPVTLTVVTPPDPNSIPLLLLYAKQDEWLKGDVPVKLQVKLAPGGDPSAMKALIQNRDADFALFNSLGGRKMYEEGQKHIRLVGTHVWRGVYILTPQDVKDWKELNGANGIAVPGVQTPPHILAQKALKKQGAEVNFAPMGPGEALWTTLSENQQGIKVVAAPEPLVSMILMRQEKDNWKTKYKVFADPVEVLNPEGKIFPLGAVWLVNDKLLDTPEGVKAGKAFVEGFKKAIAYANDPANRQEAVQLLPKYWKEVFNQEAPPKLFEMMLSSGRLGLDFKGGPEAKDTVFSLWKNVMGVEGDPGIICTKLYQ